MHKEDSIDTHTLTLDGNPLTFWFEHRLAYPTLFQLPQLMLSDNLAQVE